MPQPEGLVLVFLASEPKMIASALNLLKHTQFPVWILSFYTFIWFLQIGNRINILGTIRIEFIVGSALVALSLIAWANQKKCQDFFHHGFVRSIYFLYIFFIVYTIFSYNPEASSAVFVDRILKFSMFTLFIGTLVKNKYDVAIILLGFFLAMGKIIQEGVHGIVTGGMIWENQGIPRLHGVTLLYRHPNSLSGLAVSALPFFLFLYRFQTKVLKYVFIGCIIGLLAIVLYTGSRTGYVATLILATAVVMRLGLFKLKNILALAVLIPVIFMIIPQDYKNRFNTMFQSEEERGSSVNKRIEILEDAWEIAKKYPLGVGVQAFPHIREIEFSRTQDTHNLYLEILTNLGPFGLLAFVIFIAMLFKTNRLSRAIHIRKKNHFLAEVCYIVNLYVLCRLALGMFGMDLYEVYWWFAAGFTIALAKLAVTGYTETLPKA
ncbi:O-antigen ligase family protein [uncultured Marinimicrobium sp.]|uniref:O-antigen ligase family protein n=2 Tax=Marinimicrobium TaxID=359337 RepID=UPI0030DDDB82